MPSQPAQLGYKESQTWMHCADTVFLSFSPTCLAAASVLVPLESLQIEQIDLVSFSGLLADLYGEMQTQQVHSCPAPSK